MSGASSGVSTMKTVTSGSPTRPKRPECPLSRSAPRCFHIACMVPYDQR